jgi:hypothetical protein
MSTASGRRSRLDFDAAIVIEPGRILAERPDGGRGGLYTALTRSIRALAIVHHDSPRPSSRPPPISTRSATRPPPKARAVHRRA